MDGGEQVNRQEAHPRSGDWCQLRDCEKAEEAGVLEEQKGPERSLGPPMSCPVCFSCLL